MNIAIIGGGSWGLAISKLLHDNNNNVRIWEYSLQDVEEIRNTKENSKYLPGVKIEALVSNNISEVITLDTQAIILATPSSFLEETLKKIFPFVEQLTCLEGIINLAKGYNHNTGEILSDMIKKELPARFNNKICALSGPSHAEEVASGLPTTVTIAGENLELLKLFQQVFSNHYFRVYITQDLIGVELGGAIKNVIALAAGIIYGLGFGDNTLGALLTRGNVEIKRLALAMGAKSETLDGLAGMGDLITTAISRHSRNRYVGEQLGLGKKLEDIIASMPMVAEGVPATYTTFMLARKHNVEMPIVESVYRLLTEDSSPKEVITNLMLRDLKVEV